MEKYKVTITETLELAINVTAENQNEAERIARGRWEKGVYVLDAMNFTGAMFGAVLEDE